MVNKKRQKVVTDGGLPHLTAFSRKNRNAIPKRLPIKIMKPDAPGFLKTYATFKNSC